MKLTLENCSEVVPEKNVLLCKALLRDVEEMNRELLKDYNQIFINFQTEHTQYSCERTDPCPDYYGTYTIRFEKKPYEMVGVEMDINELDTTLCAIENFIRLSNKLKKNKR